MDSILKSLLAMGAPFVMLIAVIILGLIFILARGRKAARALGLVLLSVDGMLRGLLTYTALYPRTSSSAHPFGMHCLPF